MKKNKYTIMIGYILALVIGGVAYVSIAKDSNQTSMTMVMDQDEKALFTINEVSIPKEEYAMFLQDQKALTVNYFTQTYGAEYDADFWSTEYGEEVPIEVAKEAALEKLIRIKVEQQVAKDLGIVGDTYFNTMVEQLEKNKSIYGAENMDLFQKYLVYHSKLVLEAKEKFKNSYQKINEKTLKAKYEELKEVLFDTPDQLNVMEITIEVLKGNDSESVLNEVVKDIDQEISIDDLINKYKDRAIITTKEKDYGIYEGKDSDFSEQDFMLKETAYTLEPGEMTIMIESENIYYILICMERKINGVADFEKVKSVVEEIVKEEAYEAYIDGLVGEVKIIKDEKAYDAIVMK